MRARVLAVALAGAMTLGLGAARAEDARPVGHPASEVSVPNTAPPATTKKTTASHNQSATVRQMNAAEKQKVEQAGK